MKAHILSLSKDVFLYGTGRVLVQALSIVTLPIYTRIFSPSAYGVLDIINITLSSLSIFTLLSMNSSLQRFYFDFKSSDFLNRKSVLKTSLIFFLVWPLVITLLLIALSPNITNLLFGSNENNLIFMVAFASLPLLAVFTLVQEVLKIHRRALTFTIITFLNGFLAVAVGIYLIAVLKVGIIGFFVGNLIGLIFSFVLGFVLIGNLFSGKFSPLLLRSMLKYGIWLVPTGIFALIITLIDRFFILKMLGAQPVGFYAISNKLILFLPLAVTAFGTAWSPYILELFSDRKEEEKRVRSRVIVYVAVIMSIAALLITLFSREALAILTTPEFVDSFKPIGLLSLGWVAYGVSLVAVTGITLVKKVKFISIISGLSAGLNIVLNFLLIPKFGIMGAAFATFAAYLFLVVAYMYKSEQLYPSGFDLKKLMRLPLLLAPFFYLAYTLNFHPAWQFLIVKLILVLGFCFGLIVLDLVNKKEVLHFLKSRKAFR